MALKNNFAIYCKHVIYHAKLLLFANNSTMLKLINFIMIQTVSSIRLFMLTLAPHLQGYDSRYYIDLGINTPLICTVN